MSQYTAPIRFVDGPTGTSYAYRRFGPSGTVPVLFLNHFRGNLDNWDPALVDDIAAEREVVLVDTSGTGLSTGTTPDTASGLAKDALAFVDALGLTSIDLLGFSTGGFAAQELVLLRPKLVRRLVLAGTGPRGGRDMHVWTDEVWAHAMKDVQGAEDVLFLFFTPSDFSQAAGQDFVKRIFTREDDRDVTPSLAARDAVRAVVSEWGIPDLGQLARLAGITVPTLVANGVADAMIPTVNTYLLAGHLPDAELVLYPDAGHGFLFQYPHEFAARVNEHLSGP